MVGKKDMVHLCTLSIIGLRARLSKVSNTIMDYTLGEREDLHALKKQKRANILYFDIVNQNCHLNNTLTNSLEKLFFDIDKLDIEWDKYIELGQKKFNEDK
ncbi:hypothetical protein LCGC14_2341990 [marine sediment metagenome]|uniref:Uncharacterized protein n=1 Tax=marine sediment metagenome TaxID=412755 RepID=A0A0F9CBP4_9ZZZZ